MTTPAAITSEITSARAPVAIKLKTKGPWTSNDEAVIAIKRSKDHPGWDLTGKWGKNAVEPRRMPSELLQAYGIQDGTSKDYEWVPHWDWKEQDLSTNDLEIYGVLRAEHRFDQWGWQKVNSKMGNHGVDSLFKKGSSFALCESKAGGTDGALGDYVAYIQMHPGVEQSEASWEVAERARDMVTARLEGHGVRGPVPPTPGGTTFPNQTTETQLYAMTDMWVESRINAMIGTGGRLRHTAEQLRKARKHGRAFRYFNFYAAKPLFALPGVYNIDKCRAAEFSADDQQKASSEKVFDWPDNASRLHQEFLWLDVHEPFLLMEAYNEDDFNDEVTDIHAGIP